MATFQNMCFVLDPACNIDYAAWWQAFGSIAAIIFAGMLANLESWRMRRENFLLTEMFLLEFFNTVQFGMNITLFDEIDDFKLRVAHAQSMSEQITFKYFSFKQSAKLNNILHAMKKLNEAARINDADEINKISIDIMYKVDRLFVELLRSSIANFPLALKLLTFRKYMRFMRRDKMSIRDYLNK